MKEIFEKKRYLIEVGPMKQSTRDLETSLENFKKRYHDILDAGHCVCITDNAKGHLSFQGTELIPELNLPVDPERIFLHLNTFHTKKELDQILNQAYDLKIKYILIITGDGSDRLPKLKASEIGSEREATNSVDLLRYIQKNYKGKFVTGAAFNQYEPRGYEEEKLAEKIEAGAEFLITQPVIETGDFITKITYKYNVPLFIEAWMSTNIGLLADCIGFDIPEQPGYDPFQYIDKLHAAYPGCGICLALLSFKNQFSLLPRIKK